MDALPSGKWNVVRRLRNPSPRSFSPRPLKPTDPRCAASSAGVVSTRLLLRPPCPRKNGSASGWILACLSRKSCQLIRASAAIFSLGAHARQVVGVLAVEANQIVRGPPPRAAPSRRNSGHGSRPLPATRRSSPKCSLSKNMPGPRLSFWKRVAILELGVALDLDAELLDQPLGRVAVRIRRRDAHRAAVADERAALVVELVPLRVAAEVVVVVENQDLLVRAERASPEMRRGQSGDSSADDHEVVRLRVCRRRAREVDGTRRDCIRPNASTAAG